MSMWESLMQSPSATQAIADPDPRFSARHRAAAQINIRIAIAARCAKRGAYTAARDQRIVDIVAALGEADRDQISAKIGYSKHTTATYCRRLVEAGRLTFRKVGYRYFWRIPT